MSLSNFFAVALWPLVASGVCLIVNNRGRRSPRPPYAPPGTYLGLTLVLIPIGLLLEYFLSVSTAFLVDEYIFSIALGAIMLLGACLVLRDNKWLTFYRYGSALLAVVCIGYGIWHLVGDFMLPRQTVQGFANRKHSESTGQYGIAQRYHVAITGRDYQTTAAIYRQIPNGALVRAELGAASHMVLDIEVFAKGNSPAPTAK